MEHELSAQRTYELYLKHWKPDCTPWDELSTDRKIQWGHFCKAIQGDKSYKFIDANDLKLKILIGHARPLVKAPPLGTAAATTEIEP